MQDRMRERGAARNSRSVQVSLSRGSALERLSAALAASRGASASTARTLCVQTRVMAQTEPSDTGQAISTGPARVAVITGAGSGIGAAIALRLGKRGFRLILGSRTPGNLSAVVAEVRAAGGQAEAITAGVTLASDVERLIGAAGPRLDVLIHSAGQGHCLTIDELDEEEWRQTLDVAVTGAFLTTKAALPALRASTSGPGHVIQVGSLASGGTWHRELGYGTAKGAQVKFA